MKFCTTCGIEKNLFEFSEDKSTKDGLRRQCRACRRETKHAELRRRKARQQEKAIERQQQQGYEILDALANGGKNNPHIAEVYESLMNAFGGVDGYAKWFFADFLAAKPGSQNRVKLHQMLVTLTAKVSQQGLAEQRLEMLDREDLMRIIRQAAEGDDDLELIGQVVDQAHMPRRLGMAEARMEQAIE